MYRNFRSPCFSLSFSTLTLYDVKKRQGCVRKPLGLLVLYDGITVASRFEFLGAVIFDRLEVKQRIDPFCVSVVVVLVHFASRGGRAGEEDEEEDEEKEHEEKDDLGRDMVED